MRTIHTSGIPTIVVPRPGSQCTGQIPSWTPPYTSPGLLLTNVARGESLIVCIPASYGAGSAFLALSERVLGGGTYDFSSAVVLEFGDAGSPFIRIVPAFDVAEIWGSSNGTIFQIWRDQTGQCDIP